MKNTDTINKLLMNIKNEIINIHSSGDFTKNAFPGIELYYSEYNSISALSDKTIDIGHIEGLLNRHNAVNFSKVSALYIKNTSGFSLASYSGAGYILNEIKIPELVYNNSRFEIQDGTIHRKVIRSGNHTAVFAACSNSIYFEKQIFDNTAEILQKILWVLTQGEQSFSADPLFNILQKIGSSRGIIIDCLKIINIASILIPDYTNNILRLEKSIELFFSQHYPDEISDHFFINPGFYIALKDGGAKQFTEKSMHIEVAGVNIICNLHSFQLVPSDSAEIINEIIRRSAL